MTDHAQEAHGLGENLGRRFCSITDGADPVDDPLLVVGGEGVGDGAIDGRAHGLSMVLGSQQCEQW